MTEELRNKINNLTARMNALGDHNDYLRDPEKYNEAVRLKTEFNTLMKSKEGKDIDRRDDDVISLNDAFQNIITSINERDQFLKDTEKQLRDNIEIIRKKDKTFTITEQQIREKVSPEKIAMDLLAGDKGKHFVDSVETKNAYREKLSQYLPGGSLPPEFSRISTLAVKMDGSPESEEYNRRMFSDIGRRDAIGEKARMNMLIEALNSGFRADYEIFDKYKNDPKKLTEEVYKNTPDAMVIQEMANILGTSPIKLTGDALEKYNTIKNFGVTMGTVMSSYLTMKTLPEYFTIPFEYMTKEQVGNLVGYVMDFPSNMGMNIPKIVQPYTLQLDYEQEVKKYEKNMQTEWFDESDIDKATIKTEDHGYDYVMRQTASALKEVDDFLSKLDDPALAEIKNKFNSYKDAFGKLDVYPTPEDFKNISNLYAEYSKECALYLRNAENQGKEQAAGLKELNKKLTDASTPISSDESFSYTINSLLEYQKRDDNLIPGMTEYFNTLRSQIAGFTPDGIEKLNAQLKTASENADKMIAAGGANSEIARIAKARIGKYQDDMARYAVPGNSVSNMTIMKIKPKARPNPIFGYINSQLTGINDKAVDDLKADIAGISLIVNKDDPIGPEDTRAFKDSLNDYVNKTRGILANPNLDSEERTVLESLLIPAEAFLNNINKPGATVEAAISDHQWIENLFHEDKTEKLDPLPEDYDAKQHTPEENAYKYKEAFGIMNENYQKHIRELSGDRNNPYLAIQIKTGLMQSVGESFYKYGGKPSFDIANIHEVYDTLDSIFDLDKLKSVNTATIGGHDFFDNVYPDDYNTKRHRDSLNNTRMVTEPTKTLILNAVKRCQTDVTMLGLPKTERKKIEYEGLTTQREVNPKMDKVAEIANGMLIPSRALGTLSRESMDSQNRNFADEKHPLHGVYLAAEELNNKYKEFLKGERTEPPEANDFEPFINSVAGYALGTDIYVGNEQGYFEESVFFTIGILEELKMNVPGTEDRVNEAVNVIRNKINRELDDKLSEKVHGDTVNVDEIDRFFRILGNKGYLSAANLNYNLIKGFMNPDGLDDRLSALKQNLNEELDKKTGKPDLESLRFNATQYAALSYVKSQLTKFYKLPDTGVTREAYLKSGVNSLLYDCFCDEPLSENADKAIQYVKDLTEKTTIKNIASWDLNTIKQLANSQPEDIGETLDEQIHPSGRPYEDIKPDTLKVLSENKRNVSLGIQYDNESGLRIQPKNSDEYERMKQAVFDLGEKGNEIGGAGPEDFKNAYDACINYINLKNSSFWTTNGKQRFEAAGDYLLDIGKEVRKNPALKDAVDKDFKLLMIRSESFRNKVLDSNLGDDLKKYAESVENVLAKGKNAQVSGKYETLQAREALFNKYNGRIERDMANQRNIKTISGIMDIHKEAMLEAYKKNDDAKVLEEASKILYYDAIKQSVPVIDNNKLTESMSPREVQSSVNQVKPFVAKVLLEVSRKEYDTVISDGDIEQTLFNGWEKFVTSKKNAELANKSFDSNLKKNGGIFMRDDNPAHKAPEKQKGEPEFAPGIK